MKWSKENWRSMSRVITSHKIHRLETNSLTHSHILHIIWYRMWIFSFLKVEFKNSPGIWKKNSSLKTKIAKVIQNTTYLFLCYDGVALGWEKENRKLKLCDISIPRYFYGIMLWEHPSPVTFPLAHMHLWIHRYIHAYVFFWEWESMRWKWLLYIYERLHTWHSPETRNARLNSTSDPKIDFFLYFCTIWVL